jgi:hypothetical protein
MRACKTKPLNISAGGEGRGGKNRLPVGERCDMTVLNHRSPSSLFFDCTDSDSLTNLSEGVGGWMDGENKGGGKTHLYRESNSHLETSFCQPSPRYNVF